MKKSTLVILLLAFLTVLGFGLYLTNHSSKSAIEKAQADRIESIENQMANLVKEAEEAAKAKIDAEEKSMINAEAKRMAEARALKEAEEKEALVNELNARLKQQAEERQEAEQAQAKLEQTLNELKRAQIEANEKLAALEEEQNPPQDVNAMELKNKLNEQEAKIQVLAQENSRLKERSQLLEKEQITTEEAIVKAGGRIDIPFPEIRSPNFKRRDAIYFKERVAGSID